MPIRNFVKRLLIWRSLEITLRRNAPGTVSLADRSANYYAVYLHALDGSNAFMAEEILEQGVSGRWWSDTEARFVEPCCVPFRWLDLYRLDIRYLYAGWSFRITSASQFLWYHLTSYPFVKVRLSQVRQIFFNRMTLRRYDRMKVLSHMLEETLSDRTYQTVNTQLLTDFYSVRWVQRPDKEELEQYYKMLLESLEQSGDVAKSGYGYALASKAINTVSEYELEERRHRDNYLVQRGIFILTCALAVIGAAQVYVAFIKD